MSIYIKNKTMKLICVCLIFFVISSCFCGCNYRENSNISKENVVDKLNNEEMDDVIDKIINKQHPFFAELIYVSQDKVIFNGTVGLIVYDLQKREIVRAIDLTDIHMNHIQGDDVTIFESSNDGNKILMYNDIFPYKHTDDGDFIESEKKELEGRYLYDVENDILAKTDIEKIENKYVLHRFERENIEDCDKEYLNSAYMDKNIICEIAVPKGSDKMSELQIVISDEQGNEREVYQVF